MPYPLPLCPAREEASPHPGAGSVLPTLLRWHEVQIWGQERLLVVHAGASEGCLAMSTLGERALLVPERQAGSIVAAGLTRW